MKLESSKYVFKTNVEKYIFKNKIKKNLVYILILINSNTIQDYEAFQNYT